MIDNFSETYFFLSNFYPVRVEFDGLTYLSTESAYQAAKTLRRVDRIPFISASAREAKRRGKALGLRSDWEEVKDGVMLELLQKKFAYPDLRALLKATEPEELVEGNWWGDTYWGVCKGVGQNKLGKMLMEVRDSI